MSGSKLGIVKMSASALAVLLCASFALAHQVAELHNSIGMVFVPIPAGEFMMGSESENARSNEGPVHRVIISQPFYLGKYEVTQAQWQAVMGNNPSRFTGDPNRPVEDVSWDDVQTFIQRLNAWEGRGAIYRLPTEAEWEYAVRAGTTTEYYFGDDASQLEQYAWYQDNAGYYDSQGRLRTDLGTRPVGQLLPNAWGLHDMHGNVLEWVQDWWFRTYRTGSVTDPQGPSSGWRRVSRGGSRIGYAWNCRSALRYAFPPGLRSGYLGFRLLRMAQ